jgi:hypothetical protein
MRSCKSSSLLFTRLAAPFGPSLRAAFSTFLRDDQAKAIFRRYGFEVK